MASAVSALCLDSMYASANIPAAAASHLPRVSALSYWKLAVADAAHEKSVRTTINYSAPQATISWNTEALSNRGYQTYTGTQTGTLGHFAVELAPNGDAFFTGDPAGLHDRLFVTGIPAGAGINQWYWVAPGEPEYVETVANGISVRQIADDLLTPTPGTRLSASYDGTWTKDGKKVDVIFVNNLEIGLSQPSTAYVTTGSHPTLLELDSAGGPEKYSWGVPVQLPTPPQNALSSSSLQFGVP